MYFKELPINRKHEKEGKKSVMFTLPFSPGVFTMIRKTLFARVIWMSFIWSKTILIDVTGIILKIKCETTL